MLCDNPDNLQLPPMLKIRQLFDIPQAIDPGQALEREFAAMGNGRSLPPGAKVAVGVGSRGISNLATVVAEVVRYLRSLGAEPFILPAMGSHGGATAQGQIQVLGHRGVTEETCGAPIRATMEVVSLGETSCGIPLFVNRLAHEADGLVLINRIKPHTNFIGPTESGILKMMSIGLGNQAGAEYYHRLSLVRPPVRHPLHRRPRSHGAQPFFVWRGFAGKPKPPDLQATPGRTGADGAGGGRDDASGPRPAAPPAHGPGGSLDRGRNGQGHIGHGHRPQRGGARRGCLWGGARESPKIARIHVRRLSEHTAGSAVGIGQADFTLRGLVNEIDQQATIINCLTACTPEAGMIPPTFDTDLDAVAAALMTIRPYTLEDLGIVYIKNTLELEELYASAAYHDALAVDPKVKITAEPWALKFDQGNAAKPFLRHRQITARRHYRTARRFLFCRDAKRRWNISSPRRPR